LVLDTSELFGLGDNVKNIVQLRYNPEIMALKEKDLKDVRDVEFKVSIHRDSWYFKSWKADNEQSGGLIFNIGIHYFDLLCYLFGEVSSYSISREDDYTMKGVVTFKDYTMRASWYLSIKAPMDNQERYLKIDGKAINLTKGFETLHNVVYQEILAGRGFRPIDVAPALVLAEKMTNGG
jgi:UDP-N-acetyl-2-amino-2-deoxyglucuronate dehydrogenase